MNDPTARRQAMVDKLREAGCRLTPQRLALIEMLSGTDEHPSAAQLYDNLHERFPTMSRATIYKTLNVLKELGEVLEMGFGADDNRYDGASTYPHAHIICTRCRQIIDADLMPVPGLTQQVAERSGYRITGSRVEFYGLCPECQKT